MIAIPKSACPPCSVYKSTSLKPIPPIDSCVPCEQEYAEQKLTSKLEALCLCPSKPELFTVMPTDQIKTRIVSTNLCYKEFVISVSTTKFCKDGPKCHSKV